MIKHFSYYHKKLFALLAKVSFVFIPIHLTEYPTSDGATMHTGDCLLILFKYHVTIYFYFIYTGTLLFVKFDGFCVPVRYLPTNFFTV